MWETQLRQLQRGIGGHGLLPKRSMSLSAIGAKPSKNFWAWILSSPSRNSTIVVKTVKQMAWLWSETLDSVCLRKLRRWIRMFVEIINLFKWLVMRNKIREFESGTSPLRRGEDWNFGLSRNELAGGVAELTVNFVEDLESQWVGSNGEGVRSMPW